MPKGVAVTGPQADPRLSPPPHSHPEPKTDKRHHAREPTSTANRATSGDRSQPPNEQQEVETPGRRLAAGIQPPRGRRKTNAYPRRAAARPRPPEGGGMATGPGHPSHMGHSTLGWAATAAAAASPRPPEDGGGSDATKGPRPLEAQQLGGEGEQPRAQGWWWHAPHQATGGTTPRGKRWRW
jgi:hypothetical protein